MSYIILFPIIIIGLFYLIKYPEIAFVLFVNAGIFKADPRFQLPEPLDWTILLALISIVGIFRKRIMKRTIYPQIHRNILIPYIIMAALSIISYSYTLSPIYGEIKLLKFLTLTSYALFGPIYIIRDVNDMRRFFGTYVGLSIITFGDVIMAGEIQTFKYNFTQAFGSSGYLVLGKISGEVSIIVALYYYLNQNKIWLRAISIALLISNIYLTLITGARGSAIALGVVLIIAILFLVGKIIKNNIVLNKSLSKTGLKIILSIIVILISVSIFTIENKEKFSSLIARTSQLTNNINTSVPVRIHQFKIAIDILTTMPTAFTGLGIGGFSMYAHGYDKTRGAFVHNIFLDIGVDIGVIGLLSFIIMIILALKTCLQLLKYDKSDDNYYIRITLLTLLLFMLFYSSVHGNINDSRSLLTWVGTIYAYETILRKQIYYKRHQIGR
jgi:O-antigen ligase